MHDGSIGGLIWYEGIIHDNILPTQTCKIHALYTLFETFSFKDEDDYEYEIFLMLSSARA